MAVLFNGTSDYVDLGQSAQLQTPARTFACWASVRSLAGAYAAPMSINTGVDFNFFQLLVKSSGKLALYVGTNVAATVFYDGTGSNTLSVNTLYHLAMTYDSTAGLVGYVNGAVDGTAAANNALTAASATPAWLGNDPGVPTRFFPGTLSHAAMYNTALSATQIALLASGLSPLAVGGASVAGYWPLAGNNAERDRGPNGLLATLYGPKPAAEDAFPIPYPDRILSSSFAEGEMPALFPSTWPPAGPYGTPNLVQSTLRF